MKLYVNQKEVTTEVRFLSELLAELQLPMQGVAVAVNQKIVKRTEWALTELQPDMKITIIRAVCGG